MMRFVLASASPRRREILTRLGYEFSVHPSDVSEDGAVGDIRQAVKTLSLRKAKSVADGENGALIIAADTLVGINGQRLGKPNDANDAYEMLKLLSGKTHEVTTGICLINTLNSRCLVDADTTLVDFRDMSDEEILAYIATGEPMDKAGAYAIQGGAAKFVKSYRGSYDNIVGFPSELFSEMLKQII